MKRRVNQCRTIWMIAASLFVVALVLTSARDTQAQWQGSGNIYYNSGNVGIGTTNPPRRLSVSNGGAEGFEVGPGNANGDASGKITMVSYNRATSVYLANEWYASSFLFGNGNVRVSSSVPEIQLSDTQTGGRMWRLISGSSSAGSFNVFDHNAGVYRLTIDTSGSVGIGTTNPPRRLSVSNGGAEGFEVGPGNANGDSAGKVTMVSYNRSTSSYLPNEWYASSFLFGNGNVGIGVSPSYKLDVGGDVRVSGNINLTGTINAKYQDVAEWVPSSEQLAAGTVVVLDSTKSNQVISSSQSYDTRVAGVISAQPGIALGEKSDSKVLVATTGRVKVKVDASKGAIHIGDLLVTSDVPGVAMRSEPLEFAGKKMHMPGTLIGKALEPLEKGKGEILVLLSLQ